MRAAPPVEVVAALRGGWWAAAVALWLSALACLAAWLGWHALNQGDPGWISGLPLMLLISLLAVGTLAAAATLLWHARQEPMRLSWNGSHWVCTPVADAALPVWADAVAGEVDLMLDLGEAMLLRWRALSASPGRTVWLPLCRSAQPDRWHALRVALSHPTPATLPHTGEAL
jgi:hypothetical protein